MGESEFPSDDLLAAQFRSSPIGIAIVGLDGRWLAVNPKLCELVGYSEEELLRLDFQTITHPDDLDLDMQHVNDLIAGKADSYVLNKRYVRQDGTIIWIRLSVAIVRDGDRPKLFISNIEDITDLVLSKQREVEITQRLQSSTKDLQEFAQIASHDLRAPLRTVQGFVRLLGDSLRGHGTITDSQSELLTQIELGVGRMQRLVDALLQYAKVDNAPAGVEHYLRSDLESAISHLRALLDSVGGRIEITGDAGATVRADSRLVVQALLHVLNNAIQYRSSDRQLVVECQLTSSDKYVQLTIRDNGQGVDPQLLPYAATMFRRLTSRGEGLGVGLALVQRITEYYGGTVQVTSDGVSGTVVSLNFPNPSADDYAV